MAAWSFDRAVYLFGSSLEAELANVEHGAKSATQANSRRQRTLATWLEQEQKFRDPAAGAASSKEPEKKSVSSADEAGPVQL